ncbi:MAG: twin-arginine translocase TatA/TatE family subunit [Oligoflexia bacterium]|nr:twin-arginine translocase TatA/TatE family subunit [Oligoflexia bacterium]
MFGLGAGELLIIFVFALIFIGPKKLPELARSLGKGIREFQNAKDELMDQVNQQELDDALDKIETPTGVNEPVEAKQESKKEEEVASEAPKE